MKMFKRFFAGLVFVVILVYGAWCDELQDKYDIALAFVNQQIVKLVDNKATNVDYIFPCIKKERRRYAALVRNIK